MELLLPLGRQGAETEPFEVIPDASELLAVFSKDARKIVCGGREQEDVVWEAARQAHAASQTPSAIGPSRGVVRRRQSGGAVAPPASIPTASRPASHRRQGLTPHRGGRAGG